MNFSQCFPETFLDTARRAESVRIEPGRIGPGRIGPGRIGPGQVF